MKATAKEPLSTRRNIRQVQLISRKLDKIAASIEDLHTAMQNVVAVTIMQYEESKITKK